MEGKARLPTHAEGDEQGVTTYPMMLLVVRAAEKLHIDDGSLSTWALCGIACTHIVEHIGEGRRRPVCSKCRKVAGGQSK